MSRRLKKRGHVSHERWLVSYADFITLLFAFFVVLYSSSQMDKKKLVQVSQAIHGAFQQLGVFAGSTAGSDERVEAAPPGLAKINSLDSGLTTEDVHNTGTGYGSSGMDITELRRDLEEALGDEIRKHQIEMRFTPEGLVVSLREVGFFNSGEAEMLKDGQATLARIARILIDKGFQLRVEGHTDNVPIHNSRFKSNWELSTARATEVVALLVERYGFDPKSISAAGYSEYRPIAGNDTEEGRKKNRRVDIVVASRTAPPAHDPTGASNTAGQGSH
jgi:chemotaxis protein MotB